MEPLPLDVSGLGPCVRPAYAKSPLHLAKACSESSNALVVMLICMPVGAAAYLDRIKDASRGVAIKITNRSWDQCSIQGVP